MKRIISIIVAVVLLIAGAGFFFLPRLANGPHQGQLVARQLAQFTGQRVQMASADIALWPRPHMVLKALTLVTPDGKEQLMQTAEAQIDLSWTGLITGTPNIRQMTLVSPQLTLRRLPDGHLNWNPLHAGRIGLSRLMLLGGRLTVVDGARQDVIEGLQGSFTVSDLSGWIELDIQGQWQQAPISLRLHSELPDAMGLSLVNGSFTVDAAGASGEVKGSFGNASVNWPADGQIRLTTTKPGQFWNLMAPLTNLPPLPAAVVLDQPLNLTAVISGNSQNYEIRDLDLTMGETEVHGLVRVVSDPSPGLSTALQFNTLDLTVLGPQLSQTLSDGSFKLPLNWVGAFDIKVDQLKGVALPLGKLALKGELKGGTLHLNEATANLPGNANLSVKGTLSTAATPVPLLDLNVTLDTAQLRDMLGLVSQTLLGVDDGALQQLKLAANIRGAWNRWALPDFSVTLDGLQAKGQASRRDSGIWDVRLTADQIDLARYARNGGLPVWMWNLPPLDASIVVKQLRSNTQVAENVILDTAYDGRVMTVKQLNLRTLDGTTLSASGTLGRDPTVPFDFSMKVSTPDFPMLKANVPQAADLMPALLSTALTGPVNVESRWRVTTEDTARLAVITLGTGRLDTVLVSRGDDEPELWRVRVRHPSAADFVRMFALPYVGNVGGTLDFYAEGQINPARGWEVTTLQGQIGSAQIASGTLLVDTQPVTQWEGRLSMASADALDITSVLNLAALSESTGRLEISADRLLLQDQILSGVTGTLRFANNQIEAESLAGGWRNGQFALTGMAGFANGLPQLKGDLTISDAEVDWRGGPRFGVSGLMDMHVNGEASGADLAGLQSTLAGSGEFSFAGGRFMGLDFASFAKVVAKQREKANMEALLLRGGQSEISAFGGDFVIDAGVVSIPKLVLRNSVAALEGNARLDLKAPRLDMVSNITFPELGSDAPPLGMSVTGATDNLGASFEVSQLTAYYMPTPTAVPQVEPAVVDEAAAKDKPAEETVEPAATAAVPDEPKKKTNINRKKNEAIEAAKAQSEPAAEKAPTEPMPAVPDVLNALRGGGADTTEASPKLPAPSAAFDTGDLPDGIRVLRPSDSAPVVPAEDAAPVESPAAPSAEPPLEPAPVVETPAASSSPADTTSMPPEFTPDEVPVPLTQEEAIKRGTDGTVQLPPATGDTANEEDGAPPSLDDLLKNAH